MSWAAAAVAAAHSAGAKVPTIAARPIKQAAPVDLETITLRPSVPARRREWSEARPAFWWLLGVVALAISVGELARSAAATLFSREENQTGAAAPYVESLSERATGKDQPARLSGVNREESN